MLAAAGRGLQFSVALVATAVAHGAPVDDAAWARRGCEERDGAAPTVLWVGTSLSAGYGVPKHASLTARVQQYAESAGAELRLVDVSSPGETLESARERLRRHADEPVCILVVELGANEALRRLPPSAIEEGFGALLATARALWPSATILLIGTAPSEYAERSYEEGYAGVFRALQGEKGVVLAEGAFDGVMGDPRLLLHDGLHPNPRGHEVMASRIWSRLRDLLESVRRDASADGKVRREGEPES